MRTFETQGGPQQREVALLNEQQAALLVSLMRNKQTKALIRELRGDAGFSAGPVFVVNDGFNNGTYAAKELVYAYAMWISPAFHVKFIRPYDSFMQAQIDRLNTLSVRRARAELEYLEAQADSSRCGRAYTDMCTHHVVIANNGLKVDHTLTTSRPHLYAYQASMLSKGKLSPRNGTDAIMRPSTQPLPVYLDYTLTDQSPQMSPNCPGSRTSSAGDGYDLGAPAGCSLSR